MRCRQIQFQPACTHNQIIADLANLVLLLLVLALLLSCWASCCSTPMTYTPPALNVLCKQIQVQSACTHNLIIADLEDLNTAHSTQPKPTNNIEDPQTGPVGA